MSDIQLTSRDEELLKAILGEGIVDFKPQSRIEALLKRILDEGAMGGDGVRIKGYYDTVAELEAAHPTGSAGDAYLVGNPSHIYIWLVDDEQWHDGGAFTAVPGPEGNGIVSIEKTSTVENVDTYTITFDDGDTETFTVTNGINGKDGTDGDPGADGISVSSVSINESNHLIITLSDGTTVDAGVVPHNNGYPIPE